MFSNSDQDILLSLNVNGMDQESLECEGSTRLCFSVMQDQKRKFWDFVARVKICTRMFIDRARIKKCIRMLIDKIDKVEMLVVELVNWKFLFS
jgi:hypothetical protein